MPNSVESRELEGEAVHDPAEAFHRGNRDLAHVVDLEGITAQTTSQPLICQRGQRGDNQCDQ